MRAIILSVGDELVLGQTVDTNSAWLSQQLAAVGCGVVRHVTVADDQAAIEAAIRESAGQCDVVLVSGGIGPTEDDLTRQALAAVMSQPLELNEIWHQELKNFFAQRGRVMPEINKIQAMIPRGAEMIFNHAGTAAGIRAQIRAHESPAASAHPRAGASTSVFVMPGVPKEMKAMFTRDVFPHIQSQAGGAVILSCTLHTFGLGESAIAEKLGDLMRRDRNPSVGTTVSGGVVSLRINARFPSLDEARSQLEATKRACRDAMGDLIYGADHESLAVVVAKLLGEDADAVRWSPAVCTAESCTGGLLAKMLTDVAGSSAYFRQGWVTYDNEAKKNQLNVTPETLVKFGAVSEQTVREMVRGAALQSGAPFALAVSGIAGPGGGTPEKPVGTVCLAIAAPTPSPVVTQPLGANPSQGYFMARTFLFAGDREMIRDRAAKMALTLLRFHLLGVPVPF